MTSPASLVEVMANSPAERVVFLSRDRTPITAGNIRSRAAVIAERLAQSPEGAFVMQTRSAALFTAGLLAGAVTSRRVILPANVQPAYLREIGAADCPLISDIESASAAYCPSGAAHADDHAFAQKLSGTQSPHITMFTSGSTGDPVRIDKAMSQVETEARQLNVLWGAHAGEVLATVSHQHIYGLLFRIVWPIFSHRPAADEAAAYWEEIVDDLRPGVSLVSSPAHLSRLPPLDFKAARPSQIFSSGQLLAAEDAAKCHEAFGCIVTEVLGNTLCGGVAWRQQRAGNENWKPFAGISVATDANDELSVVSPYLRDAEPCPTGDRVALNDDGTFRLLGRADRMEKVDGRRVSLTRVEEAFGGLREVDKIIALTVPQRRGDLAAVVILTEQGSAQLAEEGAFALSRRLRRECPAQLEPVEQPKHWRFESAFPRDPQGKQPLYLLRALFDPLPAALGDYEVRLTGPVSAEVSMRLERNWRWFEGHFAEVAVLPGMAQVQIAAFLAKEIWGFWPRGGAMSALKFRRILRPGDEVTISLQKDIAAGTLEMAWRRGDTPISQGTIGG